MLALRRSEHHEAANRHPGLAQLRVPIPGVPVSPVPVPAPDSVTKGNAPWHPKFELKRLLSINRRQQPSNLLS